MTKSQIELFELFSYDAKERSSFRYLDGYMQFVERNRTHIMESPTVFKTFMLAGLFLTYRACNHSSVEMSTAQSKAVFSEGDNHARRLSAFRCNGGEIASTEDYLSQIGAGLFRLRLFLPKRFLINLLRRSFE